MSHQGRDRRRADSLTRQAHAKLMEACEVRRVMPSRLRPLKRREARRRYKALMAESWALTDRAARIGCS